MPGWTPSEMTTPNGTNRVADRRVFTTPPSSHTYYGLSGSFGRSLSVTPRESTLRVALFYLRNGTSRQTQEMSVGTVRLDRTQLDSWNVRQLRDLVRTDLARQSFKDFNEKYVFVTIDNKSPLDYDEEERASVREVLNERRKRICFRLKPTIFNVVMLSEVEKRRQTSLFSITCALDTTLSDVRELIRNNMSAIPPDGAFNNLEFAFLNADEIFVSRSNEGLVPLVDIVQNTGSTIKLFSNRVNSKIDLSTENLFATSKSSSLQQLNHESNSKSTVRKRLSRKVSMFTRKNSQRQIKSVPKVSDNHKNVMISYARKEMTSQAILLKNELSKLGLSVFLDIDDIPAGSDWQDSLNDAIQSAKYFVPLLSESYGRTNWTKKEVNLAAFYNKAIIPVNFLTEYPPPCLAIQFCTIQYIPWQGAVSHHSQTKQQFETWTDENIQTVAQSIFKRIQECEAVEKESKEQKIEEEKIVLREQAVVSRKPSAVVEPMINPKYVPEVTAEKLKKNVRKIVISSHPAQRKLAEKLRKILEDKFEVWVSCEEVDFYNEVQCKKFAGSNSSLENIKELEEEDELLNDPTLSLTSTYAKKFIYTSKVQYKKNEEENKTNVTPEQFSHQNVGRLSSIQPYPNRKLERFKHHVSECHLVVIVESKDFFDSNTCLQHSCYLNGLKKIVRILTDDTSVPANFTKYIQDSTRSLKYEDSKDFAENLLTLIDSEIKNRTQNIETAEQHLDFLCTELSRQLGSTLESLVYVCGSIEEGDSRMSAICREIGKIISDKRMLNVATNGFFGPVKAVNETYNQMTMRSGTDSTTEDSDDESNPVIHLLPERDDKCWKHKTKQLVDGTFQPLDYGKTYFVGKTVAERDNVVSKLIDVCVVLGGTKDDANQIEEFRWNEHYVIPIPSSNNQRCFESKVYQCPQGVSAVHWGRLMDCTTPPEEVAYSLIKVIFEIKKQVRQNPLPSPTLSRRKRIANRSSGLRRLARNKTDRRSTASGHWNADELPDDSSSDFRAEDEDSNRVERADYRSI